MVKSFKSLIIHIYSRDRDFLEVKLPYKPQCLSFGLSVCLSVCLSVGLSVQKIVRKMYEKK